MSRDTKKKVKTSSTPILSEVVEEHEMPERLGPAQARVDPVDHKG